MRVDTLNKGILNIDFNNFFLNTTAYFKGCKKPKRKPDYVSDSGSEYWYSEDKKGKFVIRNSNHWVSYKNFDRKSKVIQCMSIASCFWFLKTNEYSKPSYAGKCYLKNFKNYM